MALVWLYAGVRMLAGRFVGVRAWVPTTRVLWLDIGLLLLNLADPTRR